MKQFINKIFVSVALVLALAGFTAAEVWGETVTWQGTTALPGTATSIGTSPIKIKTSSTNTYTNPIRVYANTTVTITADSGYSIQSVTYEASSTGNYVTNAEGATVSPDVTPTVSGKNVTWTLSNVSEFTFKPSAQTRANSISITYTSAGSSSLEDSDLALTSAPVTLNFDLYSSKEAQTVSYTTSSTGAITVSESEYIEATVNSASKTITVTPVKKTPSAQTITVSQAADANYKAGTVTFTVSITDSTPYVQPTEIEITPNFTFWGKTAQFSGNTYDSLSGSKDNVTLAWNKGNGSTYANQNAMRFYKDNELTFTAPTGYHIKSIVINGTLQEDESFSPLGYNSESLTWSGSSETVTMSRPSSGESYSTINQFTITIGEPAETCATPTFSPVAGTYTSVQNVTITSATEGATVYYTTDGSTPTTSSAVYASAISVSESMTIKALAAKEGFVNSPVASSAYTIIAFDHAGTETDPYSVSDAYAAIDANIGLTGVYAKGIVSEIVTAFNSQYGNISYNISSDGLTTSAQLQAYRGKSYNGADFTSADDIKVGDVVVVYGNLKKYGDTYEFDANNQLVSLDRPVDTTPVISLASYAVNASADETDGTIVVTYSNVDLTNNPEIYFCNSEGAQATYDWFDAEIDGENNVYYTIGANTGDARTAYFKVYGLDSEGNDVYSNLVTVTQAKYVVDYATLPFTWNGGTSAALKELTGVSTYGLPNDYAASNAPYRIKFDGAGEYLQVKTDSRPGVVSFSVKMLGGANTSKFKVQESIDGNTFTDVEEFTVSGDQNTVLDFETTKDFAADSRYVRIIKSQHGSNVGVGPISITKYSAEPLITLASDNVEVTSTQTEGTIALTYKNISISEANDFGVQFYDSEDNEIASGNEPNWIQVDVQDASSGGYEVYYLVGANDGDARSAYFKVFALGGSDYVYSELVTMNQEAYVPNYAALPFEFDGGRADVATTTGLTQEGLDTDYGSSPKLKFHETDNYLLLEFNEVPGTLTFDIKGNGFSGGTFKVQTSTYGVTYTDLETYTELGNTQSEEFNLAPNVRFVKWIYTEKVNGNVALGNIKLTALTAGADSYTLIGKESKGLYWASFYCKAAGYALSEGAQAFTMNASKQLYRLGDGTKIPANTAVVILSETKTITLTKDESASAAVSGGANILQGSDTAAAKPVSGKVYVLGVVEGTLGFYEYTGDKIPAMKAYYTVNE